MVLRIVKAVVQIFVITVFYYKFYAALSQNKAQKLVLSLLVYALLYLSCFILKLDVLTRILKILTLPAIVFFCVLYQSELRRTFISGFMKRGRLFRMSEQTTADEIDTILLACQKLVEARRGALIVFPRNLQLKSIIDSGTKLNADVSTALIVSVFEHDTPLHDGAMIIRGSKVLAAGCYLPLSGQADIRESFGTRHRAALGMAEESDAVIIIVSEETGAISLAYNGSLYYEIDVPVVKNTVLSLLNNQDILPGKTEEGRNEEE